MGVGEWVRRQKVKGFAERGLRKVYFPLSRWLTEQREIKKIPTTGLEPVSQQ